MIYWRQKCIDLLIFDAYIVTEVPLVDITIEIGSGSGKDLLWSKTIVHAINSLSSQILLLLKWLLDSSAMKIFITLFFFSHHRGKGTIILLLLLLLAFTPSLLFLKTMWDLIIINGVVIAQISRVLNLTHVASYSVLAILLEERLQVV